MAMTIAQKRQLAYELRQQNVPVDDVATRLGVSKGRVSQLVKEYLAFSDPDDDTVVDNTTERVLLARAKLLELQGKQLERKLKIEANELMRKEDIVETISAFLRHGTVHADWLRKNRVNDPEALDSCNAMFTGVARECERRGIAPGNRIDE